MIEAAMRTVVPAELTINSKELLTTPETNARHVVCEGFVADPTLIGQTAYFDLLVSANTDNWIKNNIDRNLPDGPTAIARLGPQTD